MRKLILIILSLALIIAGCLKNPFDSREGDDPAGSSGTWETPATPEMVLTNLVFAYNETNIQNYQLCFADSFVFSASEDSIEAEAEGNGHLFRYWDKAVEISATENLFSTITAENNRMTLTLSPSPDIADSVIGDSAAVLYRNYTLRVVTIDSENVDTTIIEGLASFSSSRTIFNWWSIYYWKEMPYPGTDISWAEFKAEYRN